MAFRFLLVGAVAALGFDLPQGIDVDAWTQSGRTWWHARVAEFEARHGIALVELEEQSESQAGDSAEALAPDMDAAFATVIEDVVSAFASDGQTEEIAVPDAASQLVAGVDDPAYGPDFADALNRWADGLSEPEDPALLVAEASEFEAEFEIDSGVASISGVAGLAFASLDHEEDSHSIAASSTVSADEDMEASEEIEPLDSGEPRLVKAVQLTGQALQAWLALVQPASPTVIPAS